MSWNEINRIPILSVAKRLGLQVKNNKMLCFGGHDNDASLSFNVQKNYWNCFGCELGGGAVELVMQAHKCNRTEALKWLQNIFLSKNAGSFRQKKVFYQKRTDVNSDLNKPDPAIYNWILKQSPLRQKGKQYLASRKISEDTARRLSLGEISEPQHLYAKAKERFGYQALKNAGLIYNTTNGGRFMFNCDALLLPFFNTDNNLIYFQGRIFKENTKLRWLGPKGIVKPLYNLQCLRGLARGSQVYICEGATDTIAATQYGLNAIGVLGANSFNDDWVKLLSPYRIRLLPDQDEAGKVFVKKIKSAFKKRGLSIEVLKISRGKDFSEYLQISSEENTL